MTSALWAEDPDHDERRALYVYTVDDTEGYTVALRGDDAVRFLHQLTTFHETVVSR